MIWENLKLSLRLYSRPLSAMSGIIDEGNFLYGAAAVVAISLLLQFTVRTRIYERYEAVIAPPAQHQTARAQGEAAPAVPSGKEPSEEDEEDLPRGPVVQRLPLPLVGNYGWWFVSFAPFSAWTTLLALAALYVPSTILALVLVAPLGSFGVVLRRDYGPLLACTLVGWAAAHLPFALAGFALTPLKLGAGSAFALWLAGNLYFGFLMICALRTLCGVGYQHAAGAVALSWLSFCGESVVFKVGFSLISSPFLLFWIAPLLLGTIYAVTSAYRQRQRFSRNLEAATINPRDSEAHYQLGLIHQQRHQYHAAMERFKRAVEIDPRETDAHYQLGRIAREQGRLSEAIEHFGVVVTQDDKHAHSEVWREIGATYTAAAMYEEARSALERYLERRSYDPEGLYHYGEALNYLGQIEPAREVFRRCIEAAKTLPYYHRHQGRRWQKLAGSRLAARKERARGAGASSINHD